MITIMILSGLLSSMYVWSDKVSDMRVSVNDIFMIGLMTSWMCLFMSLSRGEHAVTLLSTVSVVFFLIAIRRQYFIDLKQYYTGMIPHHSMALLMSKKLIDNNEVSKDDIDFVNGIITTQEQEIKWMKDRLVRDY